MVRIEAEEQAKQLRVAYLKLEAVKELGNRKALVWLSERASQGET
jgi:hypothetical protein